MSERDYEVVVRSRQFESNWVTNIQSSKSSKEKHSRAERIVSSLPRSQRPVLNAGANVGFHSRLASLRGYSVMSLDPSVEALKAGMKMGWITEAIRGDVMHLPFRAKCFSAAIFSEVIEEIPRPDLGISELARCSDRVIITTSPVKSDLFYGLAKRVKALLGKEPTEFAHVGEIDPDTLFEIVRENAMSIVSVSYHNPFHLWNIFALLPGFRLLDVSKLESLLGLKRVCASIFLVCDAPRLAT